MTKQYMRRIPMGQANPIQQPLSTTQIVVGGVVLYTLYLAATGQLDSESTAMRSPTDPMFL
jgi:hypothetical protein